MSYIYFIVSPINFCISYLNFYIYFLSKLFYPFFQKINLILKSISHLQFHIFHSCFTLCRYKKFQMFRVICVVYSLFDLPSSPFVYGLYRIYVCNRISSSVFSTFPPCISSFVIESSFLFSHVSLSV